MVNEVLPEHLRDYNRVWDKKTTAQVLDRLAREMPEEYPKIVGRLADIGRKIAWSQAGFSLAPSDLLDTPTTRKLKLQLRNDLRRAYRTIRDPQQLQQVIFQIGEKYRDRLAQAALDDSAKEGNPLADMVIGAGRGNRFHVNSLRGADVFYADHFGRPVPVPVPRSYSEGLRLHEYFAASFGARKGVIDTKEATRDAGYLSKQLIQSMHRLVSEYDEDRPSPYPRGMPVSVDDEDSIGALLAVDTGSYKRNTVITGKVLRRLKDLGHKEILVRSPTVGGPPDGGVYAYDVGIRERGAIPPRGDFVGIAAAQALSEPITQSQLSSKHSGGRVGAEAGSVSGFQLINQFLQVPKHYRGGATYAQEDGQVTAVKKAPQGGYYVTINERQHYVFPGEEVLVSVGDRVEAGDEISTGIPNPAEIVRHKGVGEGRRYFVEKFREMLENLGLSAHRRNIELLARGLIDHVQLTDNLGDYLEGDIIPYHAIEHGWQPREGAEPRHPKQAKGWYLEAPVLHYTIGTKLRPSVIRTLQKFGVERVLAHPEPPPFRPVLVPARTSITQDPDWMTRMLGGYQQKGLLQATHRGDVSDEKSTSFVPSLVRGLDFGKEGPLRAWEKQDLEQAKQITQSLFAE